MCGQGIYVEGKTGVDILSKELAGMYQYFTDLVTDISTFPGLRIITVQNKLEEKVMTDTNIHEQ